MFWVIVKFIKTLSTLHYHTITFSTVAITPDHMPADCFNSKDHVDFIINKFQFNSISELFKCYSYIHRADHVIIQVTSRPISVVPILLLNS